MPTVVFKGIADSKCQIVIYKSVEVNEQQANMFSGLGRADAIKATLAVYYPGITINPELITIEVVV